MRGFGRPLEADQPPHKSVVACVRAGGIIAGEQQVKALLGFLERTIELQPELAEAWSTDRDQERLDRFRPSGQIGQTLVDQLRPGKGSLHKKSRTHHSQTVAPTTNPSSSRGRETLYAAAPIALDSQGDTDAPWCRSVL